MRTINEGTRQRYRFAFENESRERFIPATVRYRLDDITEPTRIELIGWTDVSVAGLTVGLPMEILLPSSINRILNNCHRYEVRVLTVQSDYGTDDQLSDEDRYQVKNLAGFQ